MPPPPPPVAEQAPEPAKEVLEVAPINGEEPAKEDRMWRPPPKKEMTESKKKGSAGYV